MTLIISQKSMRSLPSTAVWFVCLVVSSGLTSRSFAVTKIQEQLKAEHNRVLDQLNAKNAKGELSDLDDPRFPALFKQGWVIAGHWAANYLDCHPSPTSKQLNHIFDGFAPPPQGEKSKYGDFLEYNAYHFEGSAVRIAPSVFVVAASYGIEFRTGTFMVLARSHDGHFQALWNIKEIAEKHYASGDEIGRWWHLTRRAYYNGPLNMDRILALPRSANGHPRFLINAHQDADGSTELDQLSIWEWDGSEAKPLIIEPYEFAIDHGGFSFDGKQIMIQTKEPLTTLFSASPNPEPRAEWTIRVTPTVVRDLGRRFLKPELQWADTLLSRIDKGEDTSELSKGDVRNGIETEIQQIKNENLKYSIEPEDFSWGMLESCRILQRGTHGAFILSLDEATMKFRYVMRNGTPYFTDVHFQ